MVLSEQNNHYDVQNKLLAFSDKISLQTAELFLKLMEENGLKEDEAVVLVAKSITDMAGVILSRACEDNRQDFFTEACKNMADSIHANFQGQMNKWGFINGKVGNA